MQTFAVGLSFFVTENSLFFTRPHKLVNTARYTHKHIIWSNQIENGIWNWCTCWFFGKYYLTRIKLKGTQNTWGHTWAHGCVLPENTCKCAPMKDTGIRNSPLGSLPPLSPSFFRCMHTHMYPPPSLPSSPRWEGGGPLKWRWSQLENPRAHLDHITSGFCLCSWLT